MRRPETLQDVCHEVCGSVVAKRDKTMSEAKPETLYDLCELTAEAIETQPLNYHQSYWICDAKKEVSIRACGTAFCRAGWMYALSTKQPETLPHILAGKKGSDVIYTSMMKKLTAAGIPHKNIEDLFAEADYNSHYHIGLCDINPGDPEYARIGAEGMRQFMREYEKELRRAKVDA